MVTLRPEQMSFRRRAADKVVGGSNMLDIATIAVGIATVNPVIAGWGVTSFALGKEVQSQWIRKKPVNKGFERNGMQMTIPPKGDIYVGEKK